jgi:DNA-binding phage protein
MTILTLTWDVIDHLKTPEDIVAYIQAILDEGDSVLTAAALNDIARAIGSIANSV